MRFRLVLMGICAALMPLSVQAATETPAEELSPAVFYAHGGYLEGKSRNVAKYHLNKIKKRFEKAGFIVKAPLRKTRRPKIKSAARQMKKQWTALKNTEGVDPDRMILVGFSRGGDIALHTMTTKKKNTDRRIVPDAAVIIESFPSDELSHKGGYDRYQDYVSAAKRISSPMLLMRGANSTNGDDVQALASKLKTKKKVKYFSGSTGHQWFFDHTNPWLKNVKKFVNCKKPYKKVCVK